MVMLVWLVLPVVGFAVDGTSNLHQVGVMPANTFSNFIWNDTLYNAEGYTIRCYNIGPGVNLSALSYKEYGGEAIYPEKVQSLYVAGGSCMQRRHIPLPLPALTTNCILRFLAIYQIPGIS